MKFLQFTQNDLLMSSDQSTPKPSNFTSMLKSAVVSFIKNIIHKLLQIPFFWKFICVISDEFIAEQKRVERRILKLFADDDAVIQDGPFKGMLYGSEAIGGAILPKLVGSYENELAYLFHTFPDKSYDNIIDIGSAEGYYIVGLARLMPSAKVYAFDIDPKAHQLCLENAERNHVEKQIIFKDYCSPEELSKIIEGNTLIICDCEGYEGVILDPVACPKLKHCDIVVELHDFIAPGVSELISMRFRNTHESTVIPEKPRNASQFRALDRLRPHEKSMALNEKRGCKMEWAFYNAIKD